MSFDARAFGDFAPDKDLEMSGIWIKVGEARFLIRRSGGANKAYDRAVSHYSKRFSKELRRGTLDNEVAEAEVILPAFVDTVVIDWEGVKDEEGVDLPFDRGTCKDLLKQFPDVFDTLREYASDLASFRRQDAEEAADRLGES